MRITAPLAALLLLLAPAVAAHAQPRRAEEPLLHIGPRAAIAAVVTYSGPAPALADPESDMTRRLRGVAVELSAQDLARLRAAIPGNAPRTASTEGAAELFTLSLSAPGGGAKVVRLLRTPDGVLLGAEEGADGSPGSGKLSIPLDGAKVLDIIRHWPPYRGDFSAPSPAEKPGTVFQLQHPYDPVTFALDPPTVAQRIFGRGSRAEPALLIHDDETFFARLPRAYDPRRAAGLLVYLDPTDRGEPPQPLFDAADELGFVIVGAADSGNGRPVIDRMQLALDAAAVVASRFLIDPERVYAVGLSGGGKVASMLWAGFPEVFRGGVSMVGISVYQNIPAGPSRLWRAGFTKPTGERWARLRPHRLAAITGPRDGNQSHILAAVAVMRTDGLAVQAFNHPDLGHEFPSPARCREAIAWVDAPAREKRAAEAAAAAALLEEFKKQDAGPGRLDGLARRRALVGITAAAPWSPAAWEAAAMLGLTPHTDDPALPTPTPRP